MKNKINKKDLAFHIFSTACIALSVWVFSLMRQLNGEPVTKMFIDILVILLLVILNTAVLVLYEIIKRNRK